MKRAAIIGLGRVACLLEDDPLRDKPATHMGAYLKTPGVEVVAGADTIGEKREGFASRYGARIYEDYREMLSKEGPDIVSIAAYATERREMVVAAMEAGVKGIWCEKAFASSLEEADDIVERARKLGVTVIVSHMRRWSAEHIAVKKLIDEGRIGKLESINVLFSGSLLHTGTHAFDLLRWLAGEAIWVEGSLEAAPGSGDGSDRDFIWSLEDDPGGRALIEFSSGIYANIQACSKDYFLFELDIVGTGGRIRIGNNEVLELYLPAESTHYEGISELRLSEFPAFEPVNIWTAAAGNLLSSMDGDSENMNPPEDGRAALEMALAIHKSSQIGGQRVRLPQEERSLRVASR